MREERRTRTRGLILILALITLIVIIGPACTQRQPESTLTRPPTVTLLPTPTATSATTPAPTATHSPPSTTPTVMPPPPTAPTDIPTPTDLAPEGPESLALAAGIGGCGKSYMDVPRKPGTLNAPEQPSDELTSSLHKQSSAADLMIRPVSYLTQTVHDPGVTFTEVGTPSGLTVSGCSYSVALGDYDNDGWVDLFISFVHIPDVLYRNNRDGTFVDVTGDAGIQDQEQTAGEGVTWGDFDNDGHLRSVRLQPRQP